MEIFPNKHSMQLHSYLFVNTGSLLHGVHDGLADPRVQRIQDILNVHIGLSILDGLDERHNRLQVRIPRQIHIVHVRYQTSVKHIHAITPARFNVPLDGTPGGVDVRTAMTVVHFRQQIDAVFAQIGIKHLIDLVDFRHSEIDAVEQNLDAFDVLDQLFRDHLVDVIVRIYVVDEIDETLIVVCIEFAHPVVQDDVLVNDGKQIVEETVEILGQHFHFGVVDVYSVQSVWFAQLVCVNFHITINVDICF